MRKARKNLERALDQSLAAQQQRVSEEGDARVAALETWQKRRLSRSYADFARHPRYRAATLFFTQELYAPVNQKDRDEDLQRMIPFMVRLLPASAVETAANAIALQALTLDLDLAVTHALTGDAADIRSMDWASYTDAYRCVGRRGDRERQIDLIIQVGEDLDRMVRRSLILTTMKLCRTPARLAGLSDLHEFLTHGFTSFRAMNGAEHFLAGIRNRETAVLKSIFEGRQISIEAEMLARQDQSENRLSS